MCQVMTACQGIHTHERHAYTRAGMNETVFEKGSFNFLFYAYIYGEWSLFARFT